MTKEHEVLLREYLASPNLWFGGTDWHLDFTALFASLDATRAERDALRAELEWEKTQVKAVWAQMRFERNFRQSRWLRWWRPWKRKAVSA